MPLGERSAWRPPLRGLALVSPHPLVHCSLSQSDAIPALPAPSADAEDGVGAWAWFASSFPLLYHILCSTATYLLADPLAGQSACAHGRKAATMDQAVLHYDGHKQQQLQMYVWWSYLCYPHQARENLHFP